MNRGDAGAWGVAGLVVALGGCAGGPPPVAADDQRGAFVYAYMAGILHAREDRAAAAAFYARGSTLRIGHAAWGTAAGEAWIAAGYVSRGIRWLRATADAHPDDVAPRLALARALWATVGNDTQARRALDTAERAAPQDPTVYAARADFHRVRGEPLEAAGTWERAAAHVADAGWAWDRAGRTYADAGLRRRACDAWAHLPDGGTPAQRVARAAAHARLGESATALALLDPSRIDIEGWRLRATLFAAQRRYADAIAAAEQVVALDAQDLAAQCQLATWCLLEIGDLDAAGRHVARALALAAFHPPGSPLVRRAHWLAGRWALATGDVPTAVTRFRHAWQAAPADPELGRWYGRALLAAGDPAARAVLQPVAAMLDSPAVWIDLGDACRLAGDAPAARAAWERARSLGATPAALGDRLRD